MQTAVLLLGFLAVMFVPDYATAEAKADISGSDAEEHLVNIIRRIVKRQAKFDLTSKGDGHQFKFTNTQGGTKYGGSIYHSNSKGTGVGAFGSHSWPSSNGGSNSFGGSLNHNFNTGKTSGGLTGSHTWSHSGGGSTSLGVYLDHNFGSGGGGGGGFRLTHSFD